MSSIKIFILFGYFLFVNSLTCRNISGICPSGQELCGQWAGYCSSFCEKNYSLACQVCNVNAIPRCKFVSDSCPVYSTCPQGFSCLLTCINNTNQTKQIPPISTICCNY